MGCSSSKETRTDENVDPNKATEADARQWFANYDKDGKNGVNINDLKKFHAESYEDDPARGEREAEKFLVSVVGVSLYKMDV